MALLICATCPRYDAARSGEFAPSLRAALTELVARQGSDLPYAVRTVRCLGGCPDGRTVALDGPCRTRVRFKHVDIDSAADVEAIHAAAVAHHESVDGSPGDGPDAWRVPDRLRHRVTAVTHKRSAAAETG